MNVVTSELTIELMSEHDLLEVVEIEEKSGLSRWGWAAYYAELLGANRELMLVAMPKTSQAVERREIAGYIAARATAGELHINNVAVRDAYRRNGIGYMLLSRAIEQGKRMGVNSAFLEVRSGNSAAQALYKKCGFKPVARRPNYYSEPLEDAIVMNLIL